MDMIAYCRAMAAFCRQRAGFENENCSFWTKEAEEWDNLITKYSIKHGAVSTEQTATTSANALPSIESSAKASHQLLTAALPYSPICGGGRQ